MNKHYIQSGEVFTFRNGRGFEWSARVTRVTDKSVFSTPLDNPMNEHRESLNTWNVRIDQRLVSRCDCQFPDEGSETRLISETCHEHNYNPKPMEAFIWQTVGQRT